MTTEELRNRFMAGVRNVAAVSLAIKYPTLASAPHSLANGLQNMLAIAAASDVTFSVCEEEYGWLELRVGIPTFSLKRLESKTM